MYVIKMKKKKQRRKREKNKRNNVGKNTDYYNKLKKYFVKDKTLRCL